CHLARPKLFCGRNIKRSLVNRSASTSALIYERMRASHLRYIPGLPQTRWCSGAEFGCDDRQNVLLAVGDGPGGKSDRALAAITTKLNPRRLCAAYSDNDGVASRWTVLEQRMEAQSDHRSSSANELTTCFGISAWR